MAEKLTVGVIMDPIADINPKKDTTFALLLKAQSYDWDLYYLESKDLFLKYGRAWGEASLIEVQDELTEWYTLSPSIEHPLDQFDIILMRKDPPVDLEYIYTTNMLDHAEQNGTLVVNKPQSLRDANEKLFATWFPQCMAPTLVSASERQLQAFIQEQDMVVLKPLDSMGGTNIFKSHATDPNLTVIIEMLTMQGKRPIMVQRYIPEITTDGDKRIILVNGEPIPYGLARIPQDGQFRGNLAAGGTGIGVKLTERDLWICSQVGPILRDKGLVFVGIDVIGEYLTEINVTSPTCVRELEAQFNLDICGRFLDCLAQLVQT
jgi:glutathione synthase